MFADRAKIYIRSGKGGDGHVSFRREKYVPDGGPNGGDGGNGGSVIFQIDEGLNTLADFHQVRKYTAQHGEDGGNRNCHGKNGNDIIIKVPEGTVIKDADTDKVIADMSGDPEKNRQYFVGLKHLSVDIARQNIDNVDMDVLSMGMSGDYQVATEEGATYTRVGTGIFGKRDYMV